MSINAIDLLHPSVTRKSSPIGTDVLHLKDPVSLKDHWVLVQDLVTGAPSYPTWEPETDYVTANRVTWQFRLWEAKRNNTGVPPSEGDDWKEVSSPLNGRVDAILGAGTLLLDANSLRDVVFNVPNVIAEAKDWSILNIDNLLKYHVTFEIDASNPIQTFWPELILFQNSGLWNNATKEFEPFAAGKYLMDVVYNEVDHYAKLFGPF